MRIKCSTLTDEQIINALIASDGNIALAATNLNVPRKTLSDSIKSRNINIKKQTAIKALSNIGLSESHSKSAIIPNMEITGTSRYYSLEDGGVWIKTSKEKQSLKETIDALKDEFLEDLPRASTTKVKYHTQNDLALVIPIGDHHVGMYAWAAESGDEWNLEKAEEYLCTSFKYLIDSCPPTAKCIIANVGDFLHYNGMKAITDTHGHCLSASGRPQEMRRIGIRILRYCIEYAATRHAMVESINASGNHDDTTMGIFNLALAHIYENCDNIKIHDEPTTRHYTQHGKCLFGVVHGHQTKDRDLPVIMATEKPKEWGETKHRVWFRGHHHHDSRVEFNGAIVEQVRTLAAQDDYAKGGGYLAGRDIKAITYHSEYGEVGRMICGIDMLKELI